MSMTPEELQALNARRGYTPPAAPAEPTAPLYVGGPPPEQGGGRGAEYVPPSSHLPNTDAPPAPPAPPPHRCPTDAPPAPPAPSC
jgi:hypothetical protein